MMYDYRATMLSLLITVSVITAIHGGTIEPELDPSRPNVCPYETYENGFVSVNVTYPCYQMQEEDEPCPDGFWPDMEEDDHHYHHYPRRRRRYRHWRRRHVWKRDVPWCYRIILTECTRVERECIPRVVTKHYCCNGTEPDGTGGCGESIECSVGNGGCEHLCVHDDTSGHHCACLQGYELEGDTKCKDVDECRPGENMCDHTCVNTPGSFHCTCRPGHILDTPFTCAENNECLVGNGGCEHNCTNTDEAYYCSCDDGFVLTGGRQCLDEDECLDRNGGCKGTCNNVYGDYYCSCPEGYYLHADGFDCISGPNSALPSLGNGEPSTLSQTMLRPLILGPIVGGFLLVIIIVLIAVCCLCRRSRVLTPPAPIVQPTVFVVGGVVGKNKKMDVMDFVEAGHNKASMEPRDNMYSTPPSQKKLREEPPPYDDVIMKQPTPKSSQNSDPNRSAYENVDISPTPVPRYEKPQPVATEEPNVYTNMAYVSDHSPSGTVRDASRDNTQNEDLESPGPFAEVIKNLRKTGVVSK